MMKKTIGIFAHVDAGKTTFSEQLLYHTGSIRHAGRVDHKDTFLDSNDIERKRGITIFSDMGRFNYKDSEYILIDTPGHIDFSPEMERSISVLDYGILIISGVEGVEGHTETIWRLLEKHHIPTFVFINKMDRTGADLDNVVSQIKHNLTDRVCLLSGGIKDMSDENIEAIAEGDESLLEFYFEKGFDEKLWLESLKHQIKNRNLSIISWGSALQDQGIEKFLDLFNQITYTCYEAGNEDIKARVYKIKYDDNGNRITFLKILQGEIKVKDEIKYSCKGQEYSEKINEIRSYNGKKFLPCTAAQAGDIVGVVGLSSLRPGVGIGVDDEFQFDMVPTLMVKVEPQREINPKEFLGYLNILEAEEDSLNVVWNEKFRETHISVMGKIQLEVLKEVLDERFNIKVEFGTPEILYKETIRGKAECMGHFEPLRHYAEVYMVMEEQPRGSGITFENKCHPDNLSIGHQNLIKTHIFERDHKGILTGSPLTDVKITLINGRAHLKHTEGGDFREAVKRALRQGLEGADNVLLEPWYSFRIDVDSNLMGRVISDIQRMDGEFETPSSYGERVIINGRGPVSSFMDYPLEFQTFTRGRGALGLLFDGYDLCHNCDEVISKINYNKNADEEYTSSSVFCSHGAGYSVPWDQVKDNMHMFKK